MRVLMLNGPDQRMGAPKSLLGICEYWRSLGIEVVVLTQNYGPLNEKFAQLGINSYVLPYRNALVKPNKIMIRFFREIVMNRLALFKFKMLVKDKNFDFVYSSSSIFRFGGIIAKKYHIPHIWHMREFGDDDYGFVPISSTYFSWMVRNCDAFIANSEIIRNHWINKGVPSDSIVTIYNGINENLIKPRQRNLQENNLLKIIFSGSISKEKGQYQLIHAISLLPNEIQKAISVDFWGTASDEEYLNELIAETEKMKLCNIHFNGYTDKLYELLNDYDIGVVCSKAEAFGRVTVEYMMSELCVIASNTGANPELIVDEVDGLLYEYNNFQSLADRIILAYYNRNIISSCGINGRKKAIDRFTAKRNAREILDYCKAVAKKEGA